MIDLSLMLIGLTRHYCSTLHSKRRVKVPMITHDEYVKRDTVSSITDETMEGHIQSSSDDGVSGIISMDGDPP